MSGVGRRDDSGSMDESLLSAYVDDELDRAARASVDARLAASPEWRAELASVRATRDAVRGLPPVEAPAGFWDHVLAGSDPGVDAANVVDLARVRHHRPWVSRWRALAGAAVAAVVLGVVLVPRPAPVQPALATLTQTHAERSSLGNDVVTNLAGAVVPVSVEP